MRYLNLDILKKHCNIDDWFKEDDSYLISLGDVAENIVETDLDEPLSSIVKQNDGKLPESILHSMLLLVGHFYRNREAVAFGTPHDLPYGYEFLVSQFRNYKNSQM